MDDFEQLTLVQAYKILNQKQSIRKAEFEFFLHEFRRINFYSVVASNGTKQIRKPSDLYTFSNEESQLAEKIKKPVDFNELAKLMELA